MLGNFFKQIYGAIHQTMNQAIAQTVIKPVKAVWQLLPDAVQKFFNSSSLSFLNGFAFALPTVAPRYHSLEHTSLPPNHFNKVINAFLGDNLTYMLKGVFCLAVWPSLLKLIDTHWTIQKPLEFLSELGMQSYMLRTAFYMLTLNSLYFFSLSSLGNIITPSYDFDLCDHDDDEFVMSLLKSFLNNLFIMTSVTTPILLLNATQHFGMIHWAAQTAFKSPFVILRTILYGQAIMNSYLDHTQLCADCRYEWFASHNLFCLGIGTFITLASKLIAIASWQVGINNWALEDGVANLIWGFTLLNTQFKTSMFHKKLVRADAFSIDLTYPIRAILNLQIEAYTPIIVKMLASKEEGPLYRLMKSCYESSVGVTIKFLFVHDFFKSKHALVQAPPIQALLLQYQVIVNKALNSIGLLRMFIGTPIYKLANVLGVVNVKKKLPNEVYTQLKEFLLADYLNEDFIKRLKALANSAQLAPVFIIQWGNAYGAAANFAKSLATNATPSHPTHPQQPETTTPNATKQVIRFSAPVTETELIKIANNQLQNMTPPTTTPLRSSSYISMDDPRKRKKTPEIFTENTLRQRPQAIKIDDNALETNVKSASNQRRSPT